MYVHPRLFRTSFSMCARKVLRCNVLLTPPERTCSPQQSSTVSAPPLARPTLAASSPPLPALSRQQMFPSAGTLGTSPGCATPWTRPCTGLSRRPMLGRSCPLIRSRVVSRLNAGSGCICAKGVIRSVEEGEGHGLKNKTNFVVTCDGNLEPSIRRFDPRWCHVGRSHATRLKMCCYVWTSRNNSQSVLSLVRQSESNEWGMFDCPPKNRSGSVLRGTNGA